MTPQNTQEDKLAPLRKGLLELAVLKVISGRAVYAADILERLSATQFKSGEGTLYPLLSKLRREGLVAYEWEESAAGPPRKYYSLTEAGKEALERQNRYLKELQNTITNLNK
jgi:PadR family transcriptional regulator PadR